MKGNDSRLGDGKKSTSVVFRIIDLFKNNFLLIFRERGREKAREIGTSMREKHQFAASCTPHTGDLAQNLGMCPDWELNQQLLGTWYDAQPTRVTPARRAVLFF